LGVEESCAVVLLLLGSCDGVAGAAYGRPGAVVELILASVAAVGGDGGWVAAGLTRSDCVEGCLRDAAWEACERFAAFTAQPGAAGDADAAGRNAHFLMQPGAVEKQWRAERRPRVGQADPWTGVPGGVTGRGRQGHRREGDKQYKYKG
jgi:hypothetical protein